MYYVKVATRSSRASAKGSPRRAVSYITDNHDLQRDPGCSEAELRYIARLGEGWKTDLEGGRLPLVGFGTLDGIRDQEELVSRFEGACQPWHDRRGTTGYKSFTFTLPKELSLHAEGHPREAKAAMYAGIREALARGFPDKDITAVAAIHTRNEAGEIHFHAHVLVGKFAGCRLTRRVVSLNSQAGGNGGRRVHDPKRGWKEGIDRELARRLDLQVEQPAKFARPALVLPDGTRLPPLNRESRRELDKQLSPTYEEPTADGRVVRRLFRMSDAMDGRILEVAGGFGGEGWSAKGFLELAPGQARWLPRYEKRVETLKRIGYLTPDGKVTSAFRRHHSARSGVDTPELQRMRLDLARHAAKRSEKERRLVAVPSLWEAIDRYENIRRRVERLGITREDLKRIHDEAERRRPSPENLRLIRKQFEREALVAPPKTLPPLPRAKGLVAAHVDLQKAKLQAARVIVTGIVRLQYARHKKIAAAIRAGARRDLFYAKERRLAQVGRFFRPIFWVSRGILPRQTRRLELAIARCVALVRTQELVQVRRRNFVTERKASLLAAAARLERPRQLQLRPEVQAARAAIPKEADRDVRRLTAGIERLGRVHPEVTAPLAPWEGRHAELVARVAAVAKGQPEQLPAVVYQAALRAAQMGGQVDDELAVGGAGLPEAPPSPAKEPARPAAPAPSAPANPQEERMKVGLDLLRRHLPEQAALLEPWAGRLGELAARAADMAKSRSDQLPAKVYEAAVQAARAGGLLERERVAIPVCVPPSLASRETEIQRVQARFYAMRHGDVFSREMLLALSPRRVANALEEVRRAGLADEGPVWALRQRELGILVKTLVPALKREMERNQGLG